MIDGFIMVTLAVALGLVLSAVAWGAEDPNKAQERAPAQGLLWQVDSRTATIYLLGIIHVGNDRLYPLSPTIESAFARADVLVQETRIDKQSQQVLQKIIFEAGRYPPGESLEQHLSAEVRALYESFVIAEPRFVISTKAGGRAEKSGRDWTTLPIRGQMPRLRSAPLGMANPNAPQRHSSRASRGPLVPASSERQLFLCQRADSKDHCQFSSSFAN